MRRKKKRRKMLLFTKKSVAPPESTGYFCTWTTVPRKITLAFLGKGWYAYDERIFL